MQCVASVYRSAADQETTKTASTYWINVFISWMASSQAEENSFSSRSTSLCISAERELRMLRRRALHASSSSLTRCAERRARCPRDGQSDETNGRGMSAYVDILIGPRVGGKGLDKLPSQRAIKLQPGLAQLRLDLTVALEHVGSRKVTLRERILRQQIRPLETNLGGGVLDGGRDARVNGHLGLVPQTINLNVQLVHGLHQRVAQRWAYTLGEFRTPVTTVIVSCVTLSRSPQQSIEHGLELVHFLPSPPFSTILQNRIPPYLVKLDVSRGKGRHLLGRANLLRCKLPHHQLPTPLTPRYLLDLVKAAHNLFGQIVETGNRRRH